MTSWRGGRCEAGGLRRSRGAVSKQAEAGEEFLQNTAKLNYLGMPVL